MNLPEKLNLISKLYAEEKKEFIQSIKIIGVMMVTVFAVVVPILKSEVLNEVLRFVLAAGTFCSMFFVGAMFVANLDSVKSRKKQVEKTINQINAIGGVYGKE